VPFEWSHCFDLVSSASAGFLPIPAKKFNPGFRVNSKMSLFSIQESQRLTEVEKKIKAGLISSEITKAHLIRPQVWYSALEGEIRPSISFRRQLGGPNLATNSSYK
jgi:hypothetical protein